MQNEPQLERIGAAVSDISRKRMLCALMDGRAHTGKELALCAGISPATASSHLAMLRATGLIGSQKSGRSTYYHLTGPEIAALLEGMAVLVPPSFAARLRAVRRLDPASLSARCCYDHIAGALGVGLCDALVKQEMIVLEAGAARTGNSPGLLQNLTGLAPQPGEILGRDCLDWSERRPHLAGALGRAMLSTWLAKGWLQRAPTGRSLYLTAAGAAVARGLGLTDASLGTEASAQTGGPVTG